MNPYASCNVPVKNANALASILSGITFAKNAYKFKLKIVEAN